MEGQSTELKFERSEKFDALAKGLGEFQSTVSAVKKDGENPHFKSTYATLDSILAAIREPMKKAKLSFAQLPIGDDLLVTILMHESGEFFQSTIRMHPRDNSPQSLGSAITYMRRYALSAILGIATDEDDDGNGASTEARPAGAATAPARRAPGPRVPPNKPPTTPGGTAFEKAATLIEAAKTSDALIDLSKKVLESKNLTVEEKATLDSRISTRVDQLTTG